MSGSSSSYTPPPQAAPPPPDQNSADPATAQATQQKLQAAADIERRARGRSSTILAGIDAQPNVARRTLLGS